MIRLTRRFNRLGIAHRLQEIHTFPKGYSQLKVSELKDYSLRPEADLFCLPKLMVLEVSLTQTMRFLV